MSKIQKVRLKNIRSITEDTEMDLTEYQNSLIRIGGRNGRGKSTVMTIGLKILLGLTPAKPHLNKDADEGYYSVTNENGIFSVTIPRKGNPTYSYTLNSGECDSSNDTLNHNRCLDVIRTFLGFDIDEEGKSALNINENGKLNFIATNGRSDLAFLKGLIYSQEIEDLQTDVKEYLKIIKNNIDKTSYEIGLLYTDLQDIKTIDSEYLDKIDEYCDYMDNISDGLDKLSLTITDITQISRNYVKATVLFLCMNLEFIEDTYLTFMINNELLKMNDNLNIYVDLLNNLSEFNDNLVKYKRVNLDLEFNKCQRLGKELKEFEVCTVNSKYCQMMYLSQRLPLPLINEYFNINSNLKLYNYNNCIQDTSNLLLTLRKFTYQKIMLDVHLNNYTKYHLDSFLTNFNRLNRQNIVYRIFKLSSFLEDLQDYFELKQSVVNLEDEIQEDIFEGGRCILCYSPRYPQQS